MLYPWKTQDLSLENKNILLYNHNTIMTPKKFSINSEMFCYTTHI